MGEKNNGIVFSGYAVEGTLAKQVMNRPQKITINNEQKDLNMQVDYISFSAHADFRHTHEYIEQLQPANIVLVHGD